MIGKKPASSHNNNIAALIVCVCVAVQHRLLEPHPHLTAILHPNGFGRAEAERSHKVAGLQLKGDSHTRSKQARKGKAEA